MNEVKESVDEVAIDLRRVIAHAWGGSGNTEQIGIEVMGYSLTFYGNGEKCVYLFNTEFVSVPELIHATKHIDTETMVEWQRKRIMQAILTKNFVLRCYR